MYIFYFHAFSIHHLSADFSDIDATIVFIYSIIFIFFTFIAMSTPYENFRRAAENYTAHDETERREVLLKLRALGLHHRKRLQQNLPWKERPGISGKISWLKDRFDPNREHALEGHIEDFAALKNARDDLRERRIERRNAFQETSQGFRSLPEWWFSYHLFHPDISRDWYAHAAFYEKNQADHHNSNPFDVRCLYDEVLEATGWREEDFSFQQFCLEAGAHLAEIDSYPITQYLHALSERPGGENLIETTEREGEKRVHLGPKIHFFEPVHIFFNDELISVLAPPQYLRERGAANLLTAGTDTSYDLIHVNDCVPDGDTARARLALRYQALETTFNAHFDVEWLASEPGRSLHTGFQVLELIGQHCQLAKNDRIPEKPLRILVNNADRSKHENGKQAGGSKCLWARVRSASGVIHDVVGVDDEVFAVLKPWIQELYVVQGIPHHPNKQYHDFAQGTQFRSLHNFPIAHALIALSGGGAPAGCRVWKYDVNNIEDIGISPTEALIADEDRFGNRKLLTAHPNGVIGIAKALEVSLGEKILVEIVHADTGKSEEIEVTLDEFLGGKNKGQPLVWNGSSRGPGQEVIAEIGISKAHPDDRLEILDGHPIGTRLIFKKKEEPVE